MTKLIVSLFAAAVALLSGTSALAASHAGGAPMKAEAAASAPAQKAMKAKKAKKAKKTMKAAAKG